MSDIGNLDSFNLSFPVIRGVQAKREYFVTMVPMRLIPNLVLFNELDVPPELRSQRRLNKGRIPQLTKYLVENSDNYVFSSLTASIDRLVDFKPIPPDKPNSKIGHITIPILSRGWTRIIIN